MSVDEKLEARRSSLPSLAKTMPVYTDVDTSASKRPRVEAGTKVQPREGEELTSVVEGEASLVLAQPFEPSYPLVGREDECAMLDGFFQGALEGQSRGGCLYVSGGPGTGKSCSVRLAARNWQRCHPSTQIVEVNCMELGLPSVAGLLRRVASLPSPGVPAARATSGRAGGACQGGRVGCSSGRSGQGPTLAAAARLAALSSRVILVVDEVDQLARHGNASDLEEILSLPFQPTAPTLAVVAIANAVDLMERGARSAAAGRCQSLLFQPYGADQLRRIVKARFASAGWIGSAAEESLGRVALELRVRQVAKQSGDCRPMVRLFEQAMFEASTAAAEPSPVTPQGQNSGASASALTCPPPTAQLTPAKRSAPGKDKASSDPINSVKQLPIEQQVLLCVLARSKDEATRFADLCTGYKEMCRRLHQKDNLSSKQQVSNAICALEQRGLLSFRSRKGSGGRSRFGGFQPITGDCVVELAVACSAVRERLSKDCPMLQQCLE